MITRNTIPKLTVSRIRNLQKTLYSSIWENRTDVSPLRGPVSSKDLPVREARRQKMKKIRPGDCFGPGAGASDPWKHCWFRVDIPAPSGKEKGRRFLHWDCRGEHTVYIDDEPWSGIDIAHPYCILPDKKCTLFIEAGTYQTCIWWNGKQPDRHGMRFDGAWIACRNDNAWQAYWDCAILNELVNTFIARESGGRNRADLAKPPPTECDPVLRRLLHDAEKLCDEHDLHGITGFLKKARGIYAKLRSEPWAIKACVVGHSHLDLVWHWPEWIGEKKGVHTTASMIRLLDQYPEFRFMWTQPAIYKAIEKRAPGLFHKINRKVSEGKWEATGGMWVEADNLLCCGETLARCMVLGQRWFEKFRGSISNTVWLLDVFGYAVCLPQIMKLSGIDHFYTTKLDWSAITRFPYRSFVWRGNDGSEVLTHMSCLFYTQENPAACFANAARQYSESAVHDEFLVSLGAGDGGGGTTDSMIERVKRLQNLPGMPNSDFDTVEGFFDRLSRVRDELPVYQGELYLELHRGTFTTQSQFKLAHRRAERALQALEAARAVRNRGALTGERWERLTYALFHDMIPGSSIKLVYDQMTPQLRQIAEESLGETGTELQGRGSDYCVFNSQPLRRRTLLEMPSNQFHKARFIKTSEGEILPVQRSGRGKNAKLLASVELPPLAGVSLSSCNDRAAPAQSPVKAEAGCLDNGMLKARFDSAGNLKELRTRDSVTMLKNGTGLIVYEDYPSNYDAWEIEQHVFKLGSPVRLETALKPVERGPVRSILRGSGVLGQNSKYVISYILEAGIPWLKIEIDIDWKEDHKLLKYHFVTNCQGTNARFGAPYGSILRPQLPGDHKTEAMWEVPGSRWAAVMDDSGEYGLALIAEAKFGFSCRSGDLSVSLLRAPKSPDPQADIGKHSIGFAVGPHRTATSGELHCTAAAAESLYADTPVYKGKAFDSLLSIENPATLVPSWVQPLEHGKGFILRMHETMGSRGVARIRFKKPPASVNYVDFLERDQGKPRKKSDITYDVPYDPYKIISLKVTSVGKAVGRRPTRREHPTGVEG